MSKSLKNFTTVREALSRGDWTPRGLRVVFLLGGWKEGVEITDELVKAGLAWEDKVMNFMLKAKDVERSRTTTNGATRKASDSNDKALLAKLSEAEKNMDTVLCDSFNTPQAMRIISELITDYNLLLTASLQDQTVLTLARWITQIVTIFGLDGKADPNDTNRAGWEGVEIPYAAQPYIYPLSQLRDEVRKQARSKELSYPAIKDLAANSISFELQTSPGSEKYAQVAQKFQSSVRTLAENEAPAKDILALCDQLRDTHLWNLSIYLEDREGAGAMVRPVDKQLRMAREEKESREKARLEAKATREQEELEKKKLAEEKVKISPKEMFRMEEYSEWDAEGLPTKDAKGEEVSKARLKKLKKEHERQKKVHEDYLKSQGRA